MPTLLRRHEGRALPASSWRARAALSRPELWVVFAIAAVAVVVSPVLDLTQSSPDPIASVVDAVFSVTFVVATRWPWAALTVYTVALATSFLWHEQEAVLSAIALSACIIVRVGDIRAVGGFFALLSGGVGITASQGLAAHGLDALVGIPLIALISGAIGAMLRVASDRERKLTIELQRRIRAERDIRAEERQVISDELHDDIAHDLTVISTYVSVLEKEYEEDAHTATTALALSVLGESTRKVLQDLRVIIHQGSAVDSQSARTLSAAFEDARRELTGAALQIDIEGDPKDERISRLVAATLSRTLREAVTNILKHRGQSPIKIALSIVDDAAWLKVTNGLPATPTENEGGFGTIRISERIKLLGGSSIVGPDGDTWIVSVRIPLQAGLESDVIVSPRAIERQSALLQSQVPHPRILAMWWWRRPVVHQVPSLLQKRNETQVDS